MDSVWSFPMMRLFVIMFAQYGLFQMRATHGIRTEVRQGL